MEKYKCVQENVKQCTYNKSLVRNKSVKQLQDWLVEIVVLRWVCVCIVCQKILNSVKDSV